MASAYMFSQYWPGDGIPTGTPSTVGYAGWQAASVIVLSLLFLLTPPDVSVAASPVLAWVVAKVGPRIWARLSERYRLLYLVWRLTGSSEFARARAAVRSVAVTPGMRENRMWGEIGNRTGKIQGVGENVFRHLLASEQYGEQRFGRLHERNLLLELAYFELKEKLHRG